MLLLVKRFNIDEDIFLWSSCIVWCLHLKIEFRSCARRRHWCDTREVEWTHSYITTTTGYRLHIVFIHNYTFHRVNQICEIFPERHNQPPHMTRALHSGLLVLSAAFSPLTSLVLRNFWQLAEPVVICRKCQALMKTNFDVNSRSYGPNS